MKYEDFLRIAEYANENWKANLTEREITENAVMLFEDYQWSIENDTISESIKTLCKNLAEDVREMPDLEEPRSWLNQIAEGLGLIDMDWQDYVETDGWLK